MAITYVDSTSTATATTANSGVAPALTGVQSGDFLIAAGALGRSGTVFTGTSYTGWTIFEDPVTGIAIDFQAAYRIADGTAADALPTLLWATQSGAGTPIAVAYRGVDQTTPFLEESGQNTASGTAVTAPARNNTDATAWGVYIGGNRGTATPQSMTAGAGLTTRQMRDQAVGTGNNLVLLLGDSNGAVATGSVTYTATSTITGVGYAWSALLKPAAGGGGSVTVAKTIPENRARFRAANW